MFDLRYHIASLAAVFVALAVGIVIGVAIAGGGNLEETTQGLRQADFDALRADLEQARDRFDGAVREQAALENVLEEVYPELMAGRLAGKSVALLFLGPLDGATNSAVDTTLGDADAEGGVTGPGAAARVTALQLPIDVDGINGLLEGEPALAGYVGDARLGALGVALGRELVRGGVTPLWDLLATQVVEVRSGSLDQPVDAVVVARTWNPEPSTDPAEEGRRSQSEALVVGLLQGVSEAGLPVVGVEKIAQDPSTLEPFRLVSGISSVDDVDTLPGHLALALLLAGGDPGHYGTKEGAEGVVPRIEPLVVTGPASG